MADPPPVAATTHYDREQSWMIRILFGSGLLIVAYGIFDIGSASDGVVNSCLGVGSGFVATSFAARVGAATFIGQAIGALRGGQ